jgi:hypothetical protein
MFPELSGKGLRNLLLGSSSRGAGTSDPDTSVPAHLLLGGKGKYCVEISDGEEAAKCK